MLENPVAGMLQRIRICVLMEGGHIVIEKGKLQIVWSLYSSGKKDVRILSLHLVRAKSSMLLNRAETTLAAAKSHPVCLPTVKYLT